MYIRVVRFTDVAPERMAQVLANIEASDGPPPGIPSTGLQVVYDEGQGTAVVMQKFETAEDMETGAAAFAAMDVGDTPGTRVSVDMGEVKCDLTAP